MINQISTGCHTDKKQKHLILTTWQNDLEAEPSRICFCEKKTISNHRPEPTLYLRKKRNTSFCSAETTVKATWQVTGSVLFPVSSLLGQFRLVFPSCLILKPSGAQNSTLSAHFCCSSAFFLNQICYYKTFQSSWMVNRCLQMSTVCLLELYNYHELLRRSTNSVAWYLHPSSAHSEGLLAALPRAPVASALPALDFQTTVPAGKNSELSHFGTRGLPHNQKKWENIHY